MYTVRVNGHLVGPKTKKGYSVAHTGDEAAHFKSLRAATRVAKYFLTVSIGNEVNIEGGKR